MHTQTHICACGFSLAGFSDFMKYIPKIILGQFNSAVPCKYHCSIWLADLLMVLNFFNLPSDCKINTVLWGWGYYSVVLTREWNCKVPFRA